MYAYCNSAWCYTALQALQFFQNYLNDAYPAFCSTEMPTGTCRIKKKKGLDRRYESSEFRSLQMNWTNSFFSFCSEILCSLAMLFWHLGIFLYGKHCLHLSHYYPFQSLSQANVLQHFRCPQGSSTNYLRVRL